MLSGRFVEYPIWKYIIYCEVLFLSSKGTDCKVIAFLKKQKLKKFDFYGIFLKMALYLCNFEKIV